MDVVELKLDMICIFTLLLLKYLIHFQLKELVVDQNGRSLHRYLCCALRAGCHRQCGQRLSLLQDQEFVFISFLKIIYMCLEGKAKLAVTVGNAEDKPKGAVKKEGSVQAKSFAGKGESLKEKGTARNKSNKSAASKGLSLKEKKKKGASEKADAFKSGKSADADGKSSTSKRNPKSKSIKESNSKGVASKKQSQADHSGQKKKANAGAERHTAGSGFGEYVCFKS
jgi:hypothetical protein